jgi:hypothetical protein
MDPPKTRKEKKKDQREKGQGKNGGLSQKHIRLSESLQEKKSKKPGVS